MGLPDVVWVGKAGRKDEDIVAAYAIATVEMVAESVDCVVVLI